MTEDQPTLFEPPKSEDIECSGYDLQKVLTEIASRGLYAAGLVAGKINGTYIVQARPDYRGSNRRTTTKTNEPTKT